MLSTQLTALLQIVLIDVTLAGDNAVVVGLAVANLPARQQRRAILAGLAAAALLRVALSAVAVSLLAIIGLTLAGGLLLLWVCWKMARELRAHRVQAAAQPARRKTLGQAVRQIVLADLSMSLDNVLAVAGAARGHLWIMAAGLSLSVLLMAAAASLLARLLARFPWVSWLGLAVVAYVSVQMIFAGWHQVAPHLQALRQALHL